MSMVDCYQKLSKFSYCLPLAMCYLSRPSMLVYSHDCVQFYKLIYVICLCSVIQCFVACRYILSRHRKVVWDVTIFNIVINVPWRDSTSDPHNLVIMLINKILSISSYVYYCSFCFVMSDHNLLIRGKLQNNICMIMG